MMNRLDESQLREQSEAFIEYVDSIIERSGEGTRMDPPDDFVRSRGANQIFDGQYIIPEHIAYHSLSLDTLKKLGRCLIDTIIQPSAAIVTTMDHFQYWAWTAAAANTWKHSVDQPVGISDFQYSVHLGLLPIREPREMSNSSINACVLYNEQLVLNSCFAVLEGLICHHGNELTPEGRTRSEIKADWRPRKSDGSVYKFGPGREISNYHDIIQIWRNHEANNDVAELLDEINDLERYDEEVIKWKLEHIDKVFDQEVNDGTNNFLRVVGKSRDVTLHGKPATQTLAPLILTLCCLFIWDNMDEDRYNEFSRKTSVRMKNSQKTFDVPHPLWPSAFYPL